MRKIGIVGAGQSGLQLAIGLRKAGYDVVVVSAQTPAAIRAGRVTSSQCMFDSALQAERDIGLDLWARECPPVEGIEFTIAPGQQRAVHWAARLDRPAMSVDQRVKMPAFMHELTRLGGELRILEARLEDLEALTQECALVIVAAGKGAIANIFERDATRSQFDRPMRALGLTYVHGLKPRAGFSAVCFNVIPQVGEYFVFPALTSSGRCEIMVFEGIPGGPMDCWSEVRTPEQHFEVSREILRRFLPWELERASSAVLTDANGILSGRFAPTVRFPVARLPSGNVVLGMADVVCVNDPITGQGSNNASKCAAVYLRRILDRGRAPFDPHWMQATFNAYWDYASYVTDWTNKMLLPPPPHVANLLAAAAAKPEIAHWFANGFDDPRRFYPRLVDPVAAEQFATMAA
jgi:2-polyprenyl-6-methoxyphenol hydroxylase-like FAD-dependent oxidoreductase